MVRRKMFGKYETSAAGDAREAGFSRQDDNITIVAGLECNGSGFGLRICFFVKWEKMKKFFPITIDKGIYV